jgi:thiamine-phosphate pyrophosphorylase
MAPAHWLLGRSVHDAEAAGDAGPVDYLYFGTVFPSASKPGLAGGAGVDALAAMAAATPLPVIAIGGITAANAGACIEAGAAGVAAIGWFVPSRSAPGGRARELAARVASVRASMSRDR